MNWLKSLASPLFKAELKQLEDYKRVNEMLHTQIVSLNGRLQKPLASDADYWNSKWEQSKIYYNSPKWVYVIEHLTYREILGISKIVSEFLSIKELDKVPLEAMKWLEKQFETRFKYVLDEGDDWRTPERTLSLNYGDCDDYAILLYYLIRRVFMNMGVWEEVKHRLKVIDGHVLKGAGYIFVYSGRHLYLNWLAEDSEWYTIESTYYRDRAIENFLVNPQKRNPIYSTINFSFTDYSSWAQHELVLGKPDYSKE